MFPPLMSVIPEARINLCIYYLHQGDLEHANVPPLLPPARQPHASTAGRDQGPGADATGRVHPESSRLCLHRTGSSLLLLLLVSDGDGQEKNNSELLKQAQQYFQVP